MGAHVLEHGLNSASLRPLAKAAGTSDRMLIYHFGSKDALIEELLMDLAGNMTAGLNALLPEAPMPSRRVLVEAVVAATRNEIFAGYIRVWHDIVAAAAQGSAAHKAAAGQIIEGFVAWLILRLPEGEPAPDRTARALLTMIDGISLMDAVGHSEMAAAALDAFFPLE